MLREIAVVAVAGVSGAAAACQGVLPDGQVADLSSLQHGTLGWSSPEPTLTGVSYYADVCGDVAASQCLPERTGAMVQLYNANVCDGQMAKWDASGVWSYLDDANPSHGVRVTYTNGQDNVVQPCSGSVTTHFNIKCAQETRFQDIVRSSASNQHCVFEVNVEAPNGCVGAAPTAEPTPPVPGQCSGVLPDGRTVDLSELRHESLAWSSPEPELLQVAYYADVCGDVAAPDCRGEDRGALVQLFDGHLCDGQLAQWDDTAYYTYLNASHPEQGVQVLFTNGGNPRLQSCLMGTYTRFNIRCAEELHFDNVERSLAADRRCVFDVNIRAPQGCV